MPAAGRDFWVREDIGLNAGRDRKEARKRQDGAMKETGRRQENAGLDRDFRGCERFCVNE